MERCPVCRARFKGDPVCRRCNADLAPLLAIEASAESYARRAISDLATGDIAAAGEAANRACALHFTLFGEALRDFISSLRCSEMDSKKIYSIEQIT
jgi:hypothetical protein